MMSTQCDNQNYNIKAQQQLWGRWFLMPFIFKAISLWRHNQSEYQMNMLQ